MIPAELLQPHNSVTTPTDYSVAGNTYCL
ncbi:protein of unknown function [Candidatus Promineifilum breve]|uniref:Uncharacterized protein n=1 Tax=Candidatus Promineifilum breve TaxID=1806508 RepID=A0A161KAE5_9CHLR|nr:protein of unknown function [Candidatus Promineifilum breve]